MLRRLSERFITTRKTTPSSAFTSDSGLILKEINAIEKKIAQQEQVIAAHPENFSKLQTTHQVSRAKLVSALHEMSTQLFLDLNQFSPADFTEGSNAHQAAVNYTNNLIRLVTEDLLKRDFKLRVITMERWITVMRDLFNLGDYQSAYAIQIVLQTKVESLTCTRENLSEHAKAIYTQMCEIPLYWNDLIAHRTHPIIPPLAYFKQRINLAVTKKKPLVEKLKRASINADVKQLTKLQKEIVKADIEINGYIDQLKKLQQEVHVSARPRNISEDKLFLTLTRTVYNQATVDKKNSKVISHFNETSGSKFMALFNAVKDFICGSSRLNVNGLVKASMEKKAIEAQIATKNGELWSILSDLNKECHSYNAEQAIDTSLQDLFDLFKPAFELVSKDAFRTRLSADDIAKYLNYLKQYNDLDLVLDRLAIAGVRNSVLCYYQALKESVDKLCDVLLALSTLTYKLNKATEAIAKFPAGTSLSPSVRQNTTTELMDKLEPRNQNILIIANESGDEASIATPYADVPPVEAETRKSLSVESSNGDFTPPRQRSYSDSQAMKYFAGHRINIDAPVEQSILSSRPG